MGAVSILGKRIAKWTYGGHGRRDRPSLCPTNSNGIAPLVYAAVDPEVIHRCRSTGRKIDLETYTFESSLHHRSPSTTEASIPESTRSEPANVNR